MKHRHRRQEQNKKVWASSAGLCQKARTLTSPPREGEPAGTIASRDHTKSLSCLSDRWELQGAVLMLNRP